MKRVSGIAILIALAWSCKHTNQTYQTSPNKHSEDITVAKIPSLKAGDRIVPTTSTLNKVVYSFGGWMQSASEVYSLSFDNKSLSAVWRKLLTNPGGSWGEANSSITLSAEDLTAIQTSLSSLTAVSPPTDGCGAVSNAPTDGPTSRFALTVTDASHISRTITLSSAKNADCTADGYISDEIFKAAVTNLETKLAAPTDDSAYKPVSN